ncbi:MAG: hypothetical protein VX589_03080 [Myxococcota bacterium]|nr:hypothetical protein [Myxococcota bacterium]
MDTQRRHTGREDVFTTGRQVLDEIRDSRSDATRVSRMIEWLPGLAAALRQTAQGRLRDKAIVVDTRQAVILIGFERLEGLVRTYLQAEYRRRIGKTGRARRPAVMDVTAPEATPRRGRYVGL